ncbi:MAG: T9SS type A sorting domain-containing protein, partial [Candidatus Sabulitectum sp.]|nr:T9SS type A sorting domain-containing protein [Candidatus Sabulitectum sp.]
GWSENFEIVPSENEEVITVTEPDVSTVWEHFDTDLPVNWSYPALLRILSGDNVSIALYNGSTLVETLVDSTDNDGSWTYAGPVPMSWTPGTSYNIYIEDDLGNFGWSENFEIVPSENEEVITVTEPDASTIWEHFDTDLPVSWEYPALLGSASVFGALSGDEVRIVLYHDTTLVDTLVASTDNDGSWAYAGPVPISWTPGTNYKIYIEDDLGNFGWSESFEVASPSGIEDGNPDMYRLLPVSPNPARGSFTVQFMIPEVSSVQITVYDLLGRAVASIADKEFASGIYSSQVNGLPAGVYVCRMRAGEFEESVRVIVIR